MIKETFSPEETFAFGEELGKNARPGQVYTLIGDLGVGKTAFVRGFASVYAPGRTVRSPTFALVNEYRVPGKLPLFHFDMYRITSEDDLYSIGYDDYLDQGICLVEWCEHIPFALPPRRLAVTIQKTDSASPEERLIRLEIQED